MTLSYSSYEDIAGWREEGGKAGWSSCDGIVRDHNGLRIALQPSQDVTLLGDSITHSIFHHAS